MNSEPDLSIPSPSPNEHPGHLDDQDSNNTRNSPPEPDPTSSQALIAPAPSSSYLSETLSETSSKSLSASLPSPGGEGQGEEAAQQPQPNGSDDSEALNQNSTTKNPRAPRRASSKIGRLSKAIRDKLNFLLRDGKSYPDILATLGADTKDITPRNVSSWHASPSYQHWLLEQEWLEDLRENQESAFDLLNDFDAAKFNQAALQLAVTRLFLSFRHLESGGLNDRLGGNARTFANLVHALARACRETTNVEKYRDACAKAFAAELKQLNVDRDISDREYDLLVKKMDQVFRVARHPKPDDPAVPSIKPSVS